MEKTLQNLTKAFIGESQARNRYSFYAKIAKKEGFEQIGEIFLETANQEKEHAKRLFEHIQEVKGKLGISKDEAIIVNAEAGTVYGTTKENLQAAVDGERYEFETMYPEFADIADEEELPKIAKRLRSIAIAEKHHQERYQKLLDQVEQGTVHKKEDLTEWVCMECGYIHEEKEPPEICPSCDHEKSYYKVKSERY